MHKVLSFLCAASCLARLAAAEGQAPACPTGDAQDVQFDFRGRCEDGNFRSFDDDITIRTFLEAPLYNFGFEDISSQKRSDAVDGKLIEFEPNISTNIGLGIAYLGYGISGSLPLSSAGNDPTRYGKTSYFDFQFNYTSRRWGADFFYQNYRGFYLKEPEKFIEGYVPGMPNPQFGGLRILNTGVGAFYNFNDRYSANAAFSQGERQLSSAGSFVADSAVSYTQIDTGASLVPSSQIAQYPDLDRYRGGEYWLWVSRIGYGYNFIYRRMTLGALLAFGPNLQHQTNFTESGSGSALRVSVSARVRASLWFEFHDEFLGLVAMIDANRIEIEEFAFNSRTSRFQLFYARLFDGFL